jgi:hypothetical protein
MKATVTDIGGGMIVDVTYNDNKKIKLPFSLCSGDMFEIKLSREALLDLVNLINHHGEDA